MQAPYADTESQETREGEASHWVASETLAACAKLGGIPSAGWLSVSPQIGAHAPNGVIITAEIAESAHVYVETVLYEASKRGLVGKLNIEARVTAKRIHAESFGTVDSYLYDPRARELIVDDYKFGYLPVEPFENGQLLIYTSGIMDALNLDDQALTVRFRITQPRPYHREGPVREWVVPAVELRGLCNLLSASAHEALLPNPKIKSGPWCRYCIARHACPVGEKAALAAVDYVAVAMLDELPAAALGGEIAILRRGFKAIESRLTGLEVQAEERIKKGEFIKGWALEPGVGKLVWAKSVKVVVALGDLFGIDLRRKLDAVTPTQAKKTGISPALVDAYSRRQSGGLKLIESNKTIAAKAFAK